MTDWVTISSLATAGGTLVLAVATFQSVRSGNRTARLAERSLLESARPVLIPSREGDPVERVRFGDGQTLTVPGHGGALQRTEAAVYFALALRNAGAGLAVLHAWRVRPQVASDPQTPTVLLEQEPDRGSLAEPPPLREFRRQQLDLFIPAGETGFWQGAMRDPQEPGYDEVFGATHGEPFTVDLLYGDHDGGQRAIVRLLVTEWPEVEGMRSTVLRYWNLDGDDPR